MGGTTGGADRPQEATYVSGLVGRVAPFDNRPRAEKVLRTDTAHVVVFGFAAGHDLKEHAAHHAVVIQVLSGHVRFAYDGREVDLRPGDLIHLPPMMRHAVHAVEDSTLTVTMLVSGPGGEQA